MPLEIVTREYAGKLLVALELAAMGFHAVVGHKGPVNKAVIQAGAPGVYFYKSAGLGVRTRPEFIKEIVKRSFITVAQDEEAGIAYLDFGDFYAHRIGLKDYGKLDSFFCWGRDDQEFLANRHPEDRNKLCLTGAPRTFLWTPEGACYHKDEVDLIKSRYNQYFLFVTNFSGANSAKGEEEHFRKLVQKFGSSSKILERIHLNIRQDKRLIRQFFHCSEKVSKTFGLPVVIRPHPGEKWETWENMVKDYPGIHVETEHDLISWIRGAKAVIQNGCTTAIEARCARIAPVFAYAEDANDITSRPRDFPNHIAKNAVGLKQLLEFLGDLDNVWTDFITQSSDNVLDRKVVRPPQGSPRAIAEVISELVDDVGRLEADELPAKLWRADSMIGNIRKSVKSIFKKGNHTVTKNKRRPITLEQVLLDIDRAAKTLKLENDFYAREIGDNCFLIGCN